MLNLLFSVWNDIADTIKKEVMNNNEDFLYRPRKFNTIELWKDVTDEQWNDPAWQRKNSIRSVDQLKKVIKLNDTRGGDKKDYWHDEAGGQGALRSVPIMPS